MRISVVAFLLAGCSLVNDPGMHMTGGTDAGFDAGQVISDSGADVGVGTDAGPVDAGPPPIEANQICTRVAEFFCDAYDRCCNDPTPINRTQCIMDAMSSCSMSYGRFIVDSRTGYDPQIAAEVLEEGYDFLLGRNGNNNCDLDALDWLVNPDGLVRFLAGTHDPGEACTPMSGPSFDYATFFSCTGTGYSCFPSSPDWLCAARHDVDGACAVYWDCIDGLDCVRLLPTDAFGTCQPRLPDNSPCMTATDCASLVCDGLPLRCQVRTQDRVYCEFVGPNPDG